MGLQINGSGASLFALRQLDRSTRGVADAQERLSSLLRLNRAADDAAGLAIAEGFRSDVRQFNTEVRSIQTGINAIQTAEGSLGAQFPWRTREVVALTAPRGIKTSATLGDLPFKPGTAALAAYGAANTGVTYIKAGLHGLNTY